MVISFNVFEDRFSHLCTGFKLFTMESFYFQRVEKALRTGIIVTFVTVQQDVFRGRARLLAEGNRCDGRGRCRWYWHFAPDNPSIPVADLRGATGID